MEDNEKHSLGRGMRIIEFLSDYANGCPLAKISEKTGVNKSTAHRLLKSLQALGYVTVTSTPGNYRLTSKFIAVGHKTYSSLNIINVALPHLEALNRDTGDTVNLSTLEDYHHVLIHMLEPTAGLLRTRAYIGQRTPLYCSAMGKIYLAYSPESYLEGYWEEKRDSIVRLTSHTIVAINAMRHELARIREERLSFDREEHEIGIWCVASPIFGVEGEVRFAISVSMPAARLDDNRKMWLFDRVLGAATDISRDYAGFDAASKKNVPAPDPGSARRGRKAM